MPHKYQQGVKRVYCDEVWGRAWQDSQAGVQNILGEQLKEAGWGVSLWLVGKAG